MSPSTVPTLEARSLPMALRRAFASREWRRGVRRMGERPASAIDPSRESLGEESLAPAFAALSQVMLGMRQMAAEARLAYFAEACQELSFESADEGQAVWLGLLAWAEAHPSRATLLAKLQQAYVNAGRSWSGLESGKLRPALMARTLFYSRQPAWRETARQAAGGVEGDPRGQVIGEDLFLWMAGVVEWAREPGDGPGFLTTGELRRSLPVALGIPRDEERCLDGLLTAAGFPGPDSWDLRLVKAAGLVMVSADRLLELVRQHVLVPADDAAALAAWEAELGSAPELLGRPWVVGAVEALAGRLAHAVRDHRELFIRTGSAEELEAQISAAEGREFRLDAFFGGADQSHAYSSLRDIALLAQVAKAAAETQPPPRASRTVPSSPVEVIRPALPATGPENPSSRPDIDPEVSEGAVAAAWRYGRRLVGRDAQLGYQVLAPLVDANWDALQASFLTILMRHPPTTPPELELVVSVLTKGARAAPVCEAMFTALSKQRHAGRWPTLLEAVLARMPQGQLRWGLARASAIVCERRSELHSLVPGLVELHERLGDSPGALEFCLRFFGKEGRGGPEALQHAARLAKGVADWKRGGQRVMDAAKDQGELAPACWEQILEMCSAVGRTFDALGLMLSWASKGITPRGTEKQRETLALEWNWALELAARIPEWDNGYGLVWMVAQEASCPVPAVWRTLVHQASDQGMGWIVREGSKRFVEAWGGDAAITQLLWQMLEGECGGADPASEEVIDLMHWLHVDLGHNRWSSEEDFARRILGLPGMGPRALTQWALRKLYSSRRWELLGGALAHDQAALWGLIEMVRELGQPLARTLEGLVAGLPEPQAWSLLTHVLPGPARPLESAWLDALSRWKVDPTRRVPALLELLPLMPAPEDGALVPAFERSCRLLLAYLLATEKTADWPQVARGFQASTQGGLTCQDLLTALAAGQVGDPLTAQIISELAEPLAADETLASHSAQLREKLSRWGDDSGAPGLEPAIEGLPRSLDPRG